MREDKNGRIKMRFIYFITGYMFIFSLIVIKTIAGYSPAVSKHLQTDIIIVQCRIKPSKLKPTETKLTKIAPYKRGTKL